MLVVIGAFIGWALQRAILNRVVGADPLPSLIATFGLSVALQNAMLQIWSADTRSLRGGGIEAASFQIGPLFVGVLPVIVLITATVLTGGLDAVLRYTRFGRALRASSADVEAAAMTGVNPKSIYAGATAIAVAILGVCRGLPVAARDRCSRRRAVPADLRLRGGHHRRHGSIWGAFIGAMVLGVSQSIGFRINPGFGILAGHLVFLMVLAVSPAGPSGKGMTP